VDERGGPPCLLCGGDGVVDMGTPIDWDAPEKGTKVELPSGLRRILLLALSFARLFWNHIWTPRGVRPVCLLIASRLAVEGKMLMVYSRSSASSCSGVFVLRGGFFD